MSSTDTAVDRYLQIIVETQTRIIENQRGALSIVAEKMADATSRGRPIFVFGTGHSHLMAEEAFYRAGGLANVVPMLSEHFMLHNLPSLGSRLERTPGLADLILERYAPAPSDLLFIFSNSGVNRLPVEMAMHAHELGVFVVGVSSLAYAGRAPLSDLGLRLDQVVDVPLDNGGPPGDAVLEISGFPWRVAPSSTIACAFIWNCLVAETARLLQESGVPPPIFVSLNIMGAAEHNQVLLDKWRPHNIHL